MLDSTRRLSRFHSLRAARPMRRGELNRVAALLAAALAVVAACRVHGHESAVWQPDEAAPASHQTTLRTALYPIPAIRLTRDDGKIVSLPEEMNDGRPVILNFIFTTCSSICPLMSQIFAQFERRLGAGREQAHLMSISIDPEQDTPARLKEYARKFHAGPEWQHYTGTVEASLAAQRAFNVWRGDKMSHAAVTFLRAAPGKPWLRIEGFVTADELLREYQRLLGDSGQTVATR
jgi:protein SCO1